MKRISWSLPVLLVLLLAACDPAPDPLLLAEDLRERGSAELFSALRGSDEDRSVRAAIAMGRIQDHSYSAALGEVAVGSASPRVRSAALFALGQLGMPVGAEIPAGAVESCVEGLDDDDESVQLAAIEALGKLAPEELPARMIPLLGASSAAVRAEACLALFRYRFVPVWRDPDSDPPELPDEAVQAVTGLFGDDDPEVRWHAAYVFSRFPDPRAAHALATLLHDENEWARLFSLRGIRLAGSTELASRVAPALADSSYRVRAEAVATLGALGSADLLVDAAEDEVFHVRAAVARALGQAPGVGSQPLELLLQDDVVAVRAAAVEALGQRGEAGTTSALAPALFSEDWRMRLAATRALAALDPTPAEPLETLLADASVWVRSAALEAVADLDLEPVIEALADEDLAIRGTAVDLISRREHPRKLELLRQALSLSAGEEWIEVRETVVKAIAETSEGEAVLLEVTAFDPSPSVRALAALALDSRGIDYDTFPGEVEPSPFLGVTFDEDPVVLLRTDKGEIEIRCLAEEAPIHVANFVHLVRQGVYDGLIWHRVVPNFVVQGGDPRGDGWGGPGYTLRDEINRTRYRRGMVGMPKAGKDTGGCQIFMTHVPTPHLDGNYTIYGQVIEGLDVIDRIEVGDRILSATVR